MNSQYVKSLANAAFAALGMLPVIAHAQLIDLGATTGYALNNAGQVALASGLYSNGTLSPLPSLPGSTTPATALAINASGQIAGSALVGDVCGVPIEYSGGTLTDLLGPSACEGSDPPTGPATSINSSGTVLGWYGPSLFGHGETTTFTYSNGVLTIIDVPCGISASGVFTTTLCVPDANIFGNIPYAINDSGEVVGTITLNNGTFGPCAYLADNNVWTCLGPGTAYAINANGQVTGNLQVFKTGDGPGSGNVLIIGTYAFLFSNGTTTNLGTLPGGKNSTGYAINTTSQIVGSSDFTGSTATHAFFYNGVMTDLNSLVSSSDPLQPFVTLVSGVGINDNRLILANGVDSRTGGATHAYLLQGPWINFAPGALTFADEAVGGTSPAQSVVVSNSGTSAIALGTITVGSNFSIESNSCTASLAPSGQCTVTVAYTPAIAGAVTGALTVPSAGVNYSVALSGSAALTASIVASANSAIVGQPLTLTWTVSAGSTCTANGSSTSLAWTASKPPFTGSVAPTGKQTLTETVAGTMTYALQCTAPGTATQYVSTSVVWSWAPVTVTISASPASITAGEAVTLTWSSSNATSCTTSGGGQSDTWPGNKATSGSQAVTESFAPTTGTVTLTYSITCTSSTSGLTSNASAQVAESKAPSNSGGGGGFDLLSLIGLTGLFALRLKRAQGKT